MHWKKRQNAETLTFDLIGGPFNVTLTATTGGWFYNADHNPVEGGEANQETWGYGLTASEALERAQRLLVRTLLAFMQPLTDDPVVRH